MIPNNYFSGLTRSSLLPVTSTNFTDSGELTPEEQSRLQGRLEAEFEVETVEGIKKTTLLALFRHLLPRQTLSLKIVGSYVYEILGASFIERMTGESPTETRKPNDIDFRIYLDPSKITSLKELAEQLKDSLKTLFGSEVLLTKCDETQDPKNHCLTLGLGTKESLIAELIFVLSLERENLFVKDALHINLPLDFLHNSSLSCQWIVMERTVEEVVAQWMKRQVAISSPEQVNRRGWGRLLVELSQGGELTSEKEHLTLLTTALLSFNRGLNGARLASLLPSADQRQIVQTAWRCLSPYQEGKGAPYYSLSDMETMVKEVIKEPFELSVVLSKLNPTFERRVELLEIIAASLPLSEERRQLLKQELPELDLILSAAGPVALFAGLLRTVGWSQESWALYQKIRPVEIPLPKFLTGAVKASPERGIRLMASLEDIPEEEKNEAIETFFKMIPPTPVSLPISYLVPHLEKISSEGLKNLLKTPWLATLMVDEALDKKCRIPLALTEWGFKNHPRRSHLVPRLPAATSRLQVECPLSYLSVHADKPTVFRAASFLENGDAPSTLFLFEEYRKQQGSLEPERLKLAKEELRRRAPFLSETELLGALKGLSPFEEEILIQEAGRLQGSTPVQNRVDELLLNIKKHLENGPQKTLLLRLFKHYPSPSSQVWITWLGLAQNHPKLKEYARELLEIFIKKPLKNLADSDLKALFSLLHPLSLKEKIPFILSWLNVENLARALPQEVEPALKCLVQEIAIHKERDCYLNEFFPLIYERSKRLFILDKICLPLLPFMPREGLETLAKEEEASYEDPFVLALIEHLILHEVDEAVVLRTLAHLYSRDAKLKGALLTIKKPSLFMKALSLNYFSEVLSEKKLAPELSKLLKQHFLVCWRLDHFRLFLNSQNSLMEEALLEFLKEEFSKLESTKPEFDRISLHIDSLSPSFKTKLAEQILSLNTHKVKTYPLRGQQRILTTLTRTIGYADCRPQKDSTLARCYRWIVALHKNKLQNTPVDFWLRTAQAHAVFKETKADEMVRFKNRSGYSHKLSASSGENSTLSIRLSKLKKEALQVCFKQALFLFDLLWDDYLAAENALQIDLLDLLTDQLLPYSGHLAKLDLPQMKEFWIRFRKFYMHPLPHHGFYKRHQENCLHIYFNLSSLQRTLLKNLQKDNPFLNYYHRELFRASVWLCIKITVDDHAVSSLEECCFLHFKEVFPFYLKRMEEPGASKEATLLHLAHLLINFAASNYFSHERDKHLSRCFYDFYLCLKKHPEAFPVLKAHCRDIESVFLLQPLMTHTPTERLDALFEDFQKDFHSCFDLIPLRFLDPLYMKLRVALEKLKRGEPIDHLGLFLYNIAYMIEAELIAVFYTLPAINTEEYAEHLMTNLHDPSRIPPTLLESLKKISSLERLIYLYMQLLLQIGRDPSHGWSDSQKIAPFLRLVEALSQLAHHREFKRPLIDLVFSVLHSEKDFPYGQFHTTLREKDPSVIAQLLPNLLSVEREDVIFDNQLLNKWRGWLTD